MKNWIVKCGIVIAIALFLLNDILNWEIVKKSLQNTLLSYGFTVEKIEKITVNEVVLKNVDYKSYRITTLHCSFNHVHLCANLIKHLMNRSDFFQEFTLHTLETELGNLPIKLIHPLGCCATPDKLSHAQATIAIGDGFAVIHPGDTKQLNHQIDIKEIPIPQAMGKVSGAIDLSSKIVRLKYQSTSTPIPIKGHVKATWDSPDLFTFKGCVTPSTLRKIPFTGTFSPTFPHLDNSQLSIHCKWNGTLKDIYSMIGSPFKLVNGKLTAEWDIKGSLANPVITGKANVSDGTFEIPSIGLFLKNLSASIEGSNLYWIVKDLRAEDTETTKGTLTGSGWVDLSSMSNGEKELDYCLNLNVKNTAILMMSHLTGVSSGNLQLTGHSKGAALKGKGIVHELKLTVDNTMSGKKQPLDIVFVNETPPPLKTTYPILFDVDLSLDKPAVISGENLLTKWTGAAHLGGTVNDLRLKGELKLSEGEYRFNGKGLDVKEGSIKFNGNIFKETTVFALATMELKELIAEIIVRGHLDTLTLSLRSNPPLPQREILSWILFNQGAKHISSLEGEQLNRSLSEFTKGGGKNPLANLQGRLGIDRIDLDRRGFGSDEEVSLKLGKYLSKNLFVGISKGINSDVNRIGFEAVLNHHWKVQGEIGDNSEGQMHLKWKNDY